MYLLLQVYIMQALVIFLSMYAYFLPYKSILANAFEIILLLNLLILMLVDATPLIRETLFTFPVQPVVDAGRHGVSHISWLLFSIYYLPVVLLVGLIVTLLIGQLIIRWAAKFCHHSLTIIGIIHSEPPKEDKLCTKNKTTRFILFAWETYQLAFIHGLKVLMY